MPGSESLALDVDASEQARACHRVVRSMHDGQCPRCMHLCASSQMESPDGYQCPSCGYSISLEEAHQSLRNFKVYMNRSLEVFEAWRGNIETEDS